LDENFEKAINIFYHFKGRVIANGKTREVIEMLKLAHYFGIETILGLHHTLTHYYGHRVQL